MRFICNINDVELKKYNMICIKFNINLTNYSDEDVRSFQKRTIFSYTIKLNICGVTVGNCVRLLNEDFRKFSSPNLIKEEFSIDPYIFKLIEKERKNNYKEDALVNLYIDLLCFDRNIKHIDLYSSRHENYKIEDWKILSNNFKRQQSTIRYIFTLLHFNNKDRFENKVLYYFYKNKIMIKNPVSIDKIQESTEFDRAVIADILLNKLKKYIVSQVPNTSDVTKDYKGYVFGIDDDEKYKEIGRLVLLYRFKEKFNKRNFRILGMILVIIFSVYKINYNIGNPDWENDIVLNITVAMFVAIIVWFFTKE